MSETIKFTEDIFAAAKEKSEKIIQQAETETQRIFNEAKTRIATEREDVLRNARAEAEAAKRRRLSEARHRAKLREQEEKNKVLSEVLETTKKRVVDVTKDEARYIPYLASFIESGIREFGTDSVMIHLNSNDLKRIERNKLESEITKRLQKPVKIEWSREPIEGLGGATVSSIDGRTRIVNTIDQRFEALESKLLVEAGKLLFTE